MSIRLKTLPLLAAAVFTLSSLASGEDDKVIAPPAATPPPVSVKFQTASAIPNDLKGSGITEEQIRGELDGKLLFLRGFYLDDNLKFNEEGKLVGTSKKGSFTLCAIDVKRVKLTKHTLELEGDRYGLHFFGALPYEDDSKPFDRVRLTGKKSKSVKITIQRELVVIPKVKKPKKGDKDKDKAGLAVVKAGVPAAGAPAIVAAPEQGNPTDEKTVVAAAAKEKPVDPAAPKTTQSPAHSARMLQTAIANILTDRMDERMIASLPDYWQHYYQEKINRKEFKPADPNVLKVGGDVMAPKLLNGLEPGSNEFAQKNGIAGLTSFKTVVDANGIPTEIAIARPIGFGLDEKAIEAIRNSHFRPATKDGQPVPVVVDLVVTFRIYSNRTRGGQDNDAGLKQPVETAAMPHPVVTQGTGR
jgi:hypothetical protein